GSIFEAAKIPSAGVGEHPGGFAGRTDHLKRPPPQPNRGVSPRMKGCPSRRRVSTTPNWVALRSQPWGRTVPPPLGEERSGLLRMSCRWAPLVEARRRALLLGRPDSPRLGEKTRAGGMCSGLRRNRLGGAAARGGVAGGVGEGAQAIGGERRYSRPS